MTSGYNFIFFYNDRTYGNLSLQGSLFGLLQGLFHDPFIFFPVADHYPLFTVFIGAPRGIRTPGLQIRSLPLYPAELWAQEIDLIIFNIFKTLQSIQKDKNGLQVTGNGREVKPIAHSLLPVFSPLFLFFYKILSCGNEWDLNSGL